MAGTICDNLTLLFCFYKAIAIKNDSTPKKTIKESWTIGVTGMLLVWARPSAIALLHTTIGADSSLHFYRHHDVSMYNEGNEESSLQD